MLKLAPIMPAFSWLLLYFDYYAGKIDVPQEIGNFHEMSFVCVALGNVQGIVPYSYCIRKRQGNGKFPVGRKCI